MKQFAKYFLIGVPVGVVVGGPLLLAGVKHTTLQWLLWGAVVSVAGSRIFAEGVKRAG